MGIPCHQSVAVVDLQKMTVSGMPLSGHHHAAGRRQDGSTDLSRKVQTRVQCRAPIEGVDAKSETRPDRPVHRRCTRHQQRSQAALLQSRVVVSEEIGVEIDGGVQIGDAALQLLQTGLHRGQVSRHERTALATLGSRRRRRPAALKGLDVVRLHAGQP